MGMLAFDHKSSDITILQLSPKQLWCGQDGLTKKELAKNAICIGNVNAKAK